MREPQNHLERSREHNREPFEAIPLAPYRSACLEARDALEVAELVRAFRKLDPTDRAHILKLSRRLVEWHN